MIPGLLANIYISYRFQCPSGSHYNTQYLKSLFQEHMRWEYRLLTIETSPMQALKFTGSIWLLWATHPLVCVQVISKTVLPTVYKMLWKIQQVM